MCQYAFEKDDEMDSITINKKDNVCVDIETGQKYALRDIAEGESVIKYGYPIGRAKQPIAAGEHVHSHNLKTALGKKLTYEYAGGASPLPPQEPFMIDAFVRKNGDIGIRNDIWIIPTVGCVNNIARRLAERTGALCFTHPYGCSQLGDDQKITQLILRGLILHPNAGGVLVLGLGCENNNIGEMKKVLGDIDTQRVRFLNVQDCGDEIGNGIQLIAELKETASHDKRVPVSVEKLKVGLKCGGSDGLSGITANPAVGNAADRLTAMGASVVLTEVPEMFGAETILLDRCVNKAVFDKGVRLINDFKDYFSSHSQPVSENPSPGNKAGGITTLEEKSLGCIQKGGTGPVVDVLDYGDTLKARGLNLLNGPGNDIVSITNMTAAGCHMILFTTGRGTPLGAPVPTVKISSNSRIYNNKPNWIDFDAFDFDTQRAGDRLVELIKTTADGEETLNEKNGFREIAIFKDGVTL